MQTKSTYDTTCYPVTFEKAPFSTVSLHIGCQTLLQCAALRSSSYFNPAMPQFCTLDDVTFTRLPDDMLYISRRDMWAIVSRLDLETLHAACLRKSTPAKPRKTECTFDWRTSEGLNFAPTSADIPEGDIIALFARPANGWHVHPCYPTFCVWLADQPNKGSHIPVLIMERSGKISYFGNDEMLEFKLRSKVVV